MAAVTSAILTLVLLSEHEREFARWTTIQQPDAATGARLFREKGCWECHRVGGMGNEVGPDLCDASLGQPAAFVAALWNATPHMWKLLDSSQSGVPSLAREELGHIYAFLQEKRFSDPRGDVRRGERVFASEGCGNCHEPAPIQESMAIRKPLAWALSMATHPPTADAASQTSWLSGAEMSDLITYLRSGLPLERDQAAGAAGSAIRGSQIFRRPSCAGCHLVGDELFPGVLPRATLHLSLNRLSASLWNHAMRAEPAPRGRPLSEQNLADLVAFLQSGRHVEPSGSSQLGQLVFRLRGCSGCHGMRGEGSTAGPAVRGWNRPATTIDFGAALWRHGPELATQWRGEHKWWPTLTDDDVGNLLAFFDAPPTELP